jgi:oligosaccharide repeat unit polymerase
VTQAARAISIGNIPGSRILGVSNGTILGIGIVGSGLLILLGHEPQTGVIGLAWLTVSALILSRLDLLHPYTWYCPFFFLYGVSTPILVWLEIKENMGSLHETVIMEWLALCSFLLAVRYLKKRRPSSPKPIPEIERPAWFLLLAMLAVSDIYLAYIWRTGLTSKFEIILSTSLLGRLNPAFSVLALAYGILLAISLVRKRIPWGLVVFVIAWHLLSFLITGERAVLLRVLWITFLLVHTLYRKISNRVLATVAICGLLLLPVLQELKNVLIRDAPLSVTLASPLVSALGDEFLAGSENLQTVIQNPPRHYYWGETLWWDVKQALLPGFLLPSGTGPAPTLRFNEEFFPGVVDEGGGRGFSLVAEGYMNFGAAGVVLWFVLLGSFVGYLYRQSARNLVWLTMYIVTMPLVVYITRADFSNLLSQFGKHVALPVVAIYVFRSRLQNEQ